MAMAGLARPVASSPRRRRRGCREDLRCGMHDSALIREAMLSARCARGGQVVFPAQRRRDDREAPARELGELVPDARIRIAPRPDARARTRTGHARLLPPALQRAGVPRRSSSPASTCPTPTPSSSTAPTASAWPSCTSCAAASAARTTGPMPTCSPPERRVITATRRNAWRRSPRFRGTRRRASPSPPTTWKSAAPANCSARSRAGRSSSIGFTLYTEMLDRAVRAPASRQGAEHRARQRARGRGQACTCRR